MSAAIICSREHSEELASGKSLETVHDTLMSSQNIFGFVIIKELFHTVWSKLHDVASSVWISDKIRLDA